METKRGVMGFPCEPVPDVQSAWLAALANLSETEKRSLYVHIPFCRSRCTFCPFYLDKPQNENDLSLYADLLARELAHWSAYEGVRGVPINTVYFGGGTPTDLSPKDLEKLLSTVRRHFTLANDCEITVEGRVNGFSMDKMRACVANGVNRFSVGVQTFDTKTRRSLGRKDGRKELLSSLWELISFNQASVVIDLLYGLPGQTLKGWIEDNRTIAEDLPVSGLNHYRLGIHKGLELEKQLLDGQAKLPDDEEIFAMFKSGQDMMESAGAARLSVHHYALDHRERNAHNELGARKSVCLQFGMKSGGRSGGYFFRQTSDFCEYRKMVEEDRKPLSYAGKLPPESKVCFELNRQIVKCRSINLHHAAKLDPRRTKKILEKTLPVADRWRQSGLLRDDILGFSRMSDRAVFGYRSMATEIMDAVAAAYQ